ncbi:MAG: L-seryl-tRNA(Sec) selenium transferase [Candidatus Latescibacteria bacterium]|nr:L-seryl-tRNA(Sec) selenium transferase [Candidatus Latescibacterota bacterium]
MSANSLLRHLPKTDTLLDDPHIARWRGRLTRKNLTDVVREAIEHVRRQIIEEAITDEAEIYQQVCDAVDGISKRLIVPSLRRAINATGVILHTGLGRAVLAKEAWGAIAEIAEHGAVLEIDRVTGQRSHRGDHVDELLRCLTDAEASAVVNNNAAAVLLMLDTVAHGREVIVSRGQLIEIGGQFRIPAVVAKSGAVMVEVGTTNKTHREDYEQAINDRTAAILAVHPSNYRIEGFTHEVDADELSEVAHEHGIELIYDLGGGVLVDLERFGLPHEPVVRDAIEDGAGLVSFSGDKLLGGPQSGIIVGRADLVAKLHSNPLMRALRCDRLTFAALEATLLLYLKDEVEFQIPALYRLTEPIESVRRRAEALAEPLGDHEPPPTVEDSTAQVGSGALPTETLPSASVVLRVPDASASQAARRMRLCEPPVFGSVRDDAVWLDMRTVTDSELPLVARACGWAFNDPLGDGILGMADEPASGQSSGQGTV